MRSSSQLFPVSLISAEFVQDLAEDVYLLNPSRSADRSVRIAITRVNQSSSSSEKPPVVLMHGFFFNRNLWLTSNAQGLAATLARDGYDVWIPELRGHGLSPANVNYPRNTSEDFWRDDLPAINDFIYEQTSQAPVWIGHGWGGIVTASALAMGKLSADRVKAVALVGSRISYPKRFSKIPGVHVLTRWRLKRNGAVIGDGDCQGPEAEPYGVIRERMSWTRRGGLWWMNPKSALWAGLGALNLPMVMLMPQTAPKSALRDAAQLYEQWGASEKEWIPVDILVARGDELLESSVLVSGKTAEAETWPKLLEWLRKTSPARTSSSKRGSHG